MSKIHPTDRKSHQQKNGDGPSLMISRPVIGIAKPTVLTVWKRSSMRFQGTDGFTVFDCHGELTFRVDNYSRNCSCGGGIQALVLMDGYDKPLLTLKPQMLSMQHHWNGYRGGEEDNRKTSSTSRVFRMKRPIISTSLVHVLQGRHQSSCEAEVFMDKNTRLPDFRIEGSFWRRNCKIKDLITGLVAAKIDRKRATSAASNSSPIMLGDDVFRLVVQPAYDPQLIMALVVILDRICLKPFAPLICSKLIPPSLNECQLI